MAKHSENARTVITLTLLACVGTACVGCSASLNKKAFRSCAPERIGIALGHDLTSVSQSADEEFMVGFFFGIAGAIINEASLDKTQVQAGGVVNARLVEAVVSQLEEKGYSVSLLTSKQIEYKAFEDISGKPKNFDHLCERYEIQSQLVEVDAVVFLEGEFEFRFFVPPEGAQLSLEDVKTRSGMVKVQMFDCDNKKVLYQRFDGITDTRNFNRVADKLVNLKKIPSRSDLESL
jgi:hypothetical protein